MWCEANVPSYRIPKPPFVPVSVNWLAHRACNYKCQFCFHTPTNNYVVRLSSAKFGLGRLASAGMKKLNISDTYGKYLDIMAISCDSFDPETNLKQGRAEGGTDATHIDTVFKVARWAKERGIKVKINTVVTINNWEEDMNDKIEEIAPFRWKVRHIYLYDWAKPPKEVFQVLLLDSENTGPDSNSLRDARSLTVTKEQYEAFLHRHARQASLVPQDNDAMKDSYLLLDENMCFLDCRSGSKKPGSSILYVFLEQELIHAGFDETAFRARGGIYDWSKERASKSLDW